MKHLRRNGKRKGLTIYLSAALLLLSIASFLIPFLGENLPNGQSIYFTPFKLLFGGDDEILNGGYVYSFHYNLNLPILIILFVELIAVMAALAGRNTPRNIGICLVLSLASAVGLGFTRKLTSLVNESLVHSTLIFGPGFFLGIALTSLATIVAGIELGFSIAYWKKKTAF